MNDNDRQQPLFMGLYGQVKRRPHRLVTARRRGHAMAAKRPAQHEEIGLLPHEPLRFSVCSPTYSIR
jgi:hypothetical protein